MIKIEIFENYHNNWYDLVDFLNANYIYKRQIIKIKEYEDKHGVTEKIVLIYLEDD